MVGVLFRMLLVSLILNTSISVLIFSYIMDDTIFDFTIIIFIFILVVPPIFTAIIISTK